jgi:hypothetical protein
MQELGIGTGSDYYILDPKETVKVNLQSTKQQLQASGVTPTSSNQNPPLPAFITNPLKALQDNFPSK